MAMNGWRSKGLAIASVVALMATQGSGAVASSYTTYTPAASVAGDEPLPFYTPPTSLPTANGSVVRVEQAQGHLSPLKLSSFDGTVRRVMYKSEDAFGKAAPITGMILTPNKPWTGQGSRPIIGWAPGTRGWADRCAPSRSVEKGQDYEALVYQQMLGKGYAVAVTDYQGLGTPGVHTYMIHSAEGNAVLDVVRAAINLGQGGVSKNSPVALFGYSQGGGAAGSAVERAPLYAPELNVVGAAVGAPPSDLAAVAGHVDGKLLAGVTFPSVGAAAHTFKTVNGISDIYNDKGVTAVNDTMQSCIASVVFKYMFARSTSYTKTGKPLAQMLQGEPYRTVNESQKLGQLTPKAHVMLFVSKKDDVIPEPQVAEIKQRWCTRGAKVEYRTNNFPTHGAIIAFLPGVMDYLTARVEGKGTPSSNC